MPEIDEAQALLAALAETEEVKAAEAQRQRRLHLQTAYGQAMMMAKGFDAEETKAAFARGRSSRRRPTTFLNGSRRLTVNGPRRSCAASSGRRASPPRRSCGRRRGRVASWKLASPAAALP